MPSHLKKYLSLLSNARLLCVGDAMIDHFVYGNVDRISPEAPTPVFHQTEKTSVLGGAANVARNLSSLDITTFFMSVCGNDTQGLLLEKMLDDLPHVHPLLIQDPTRQTTLKTRYVAQQHHLLRVDQEDTHPISTVAEDDLISSYSQTISQVDGVILSDYGKGVLTPRIIKACIDIATLHQKPIIVDPKGKEYSIYRGATLITPNHHEYSQASGQRSVNQEDLTKSAQDFIQYHDFNSILITRGKDGMTLVTSHHPAEHIQTQALEVFDVSGAGDTVIALVAAGLALNIPLHDAAKLANYAASIVVGKVGTSTVNIAELEEKLSQAMASHEVVFESFDKILSKADVLHLIKTWKSQGLTVGFTNGCFDLLHPGHLSLLLEAKSHCDRLVIGLNSDASVKRLKGDLRPINGEGDRAILLSALKPVDGVILFDEDTPLQLIQTLQPDVLIKGADYTIENVVGAKEVIAGGGKVILAELVAGKSSTRIIEKISL